MDKIGNISTKIMDGFRKLIMYFAIFIGTPFLIYYTYSTYININDGQTYHKEYINKSVLLDLKIGSTFPIDFHEDNDSYKRGIRIYGAIIGDIYYFIFKDSITNKSYKISIFDKNFQQTFIYSNCLRGNIIIAHVNIDDLNNPLYGTQENPIPIFDFKGKDKPIQMYCQRDDNTEGYVNVEPTQEEYEHNVITYLTYIMPKKEFNKRFKNK